MADISENTVLYAFRTFGDDVLRAAFAFTGNMSEAEDITQEVFLALHAKPCRFESDEHMKAYLLRAAINRSKNYRRSFRLRKTGPLEDANGLSCEFTPRDFEMRDKISALPQKYSSVIFLYYYEGYNVREIAELTGKNENTVSSLLQRARKKLKIELEKEGYHEN